MATSGDTFAISARRRLAFHMRQLIKQHLTPLAAAQRVMADPARKDDIERSQADLRKLMNWARLH